MDIEYFISLGVVSGIIIALAVWFKIVYNSKQKQEEEDLQRRRKMDNENVRKMLEKGRSK